MANKEALVNLIKEWITLDDKIKEITKSNQYQFIRCYERK